MIKTFYSYYSLWIEVYKEGAELTKETLETIKSVFKIYILPELANKALKEITPLEINKIISRVKKLRMKEYVSQYLRQIFKQAYTDKLIKTDIHQSIIKYKHKRKEGQALTKDQRETFLKACENIKHKNALLFAFYTGVRRSELLKFTNKDVFKDCIHIPGTKTESSDRYLPKFKPLEKLLPYDNEKGFNLSETTLKRTIYKLRKLCGFYFNFKDLRTTFGTMCAEMGIEEHIIAKWLGHTNTQTTRKYYIKILSKFESSQAEIFNQSAM